MEATKSKIDKLVRAPNLSTITSTGSETIQSKRSTLPVSDEFRFDKRNHIFNVPMNHPTRFDAEVASCVIHGQVPPQLDGTFYRVAPDPMFANRTGKDTWVNGDGTVHAWRFSNGVVDFKQKYVRTPRFVHERVARQSLYGAYRNPLSNDDRVKDGIQSSGNTHVNYWKGLLLANKEDSPPIALDPDTLETLGIYDFEGQIRPSKTLTAHPKVDFKTGETMTFGMEASGLGSDDLAYFRFDKHGKKLDECWIKTPGVSWTHDMIATDNWVVFHMSNFELDMDYMKKENGEHFRLNRFRPNRYIVLPRRNPKPQDVRVFDSLKNHFWGHFANGFEEDDGCIYLDAYMGDGDALAAFSSMHPELETGNGKQPINGKLVRFKINPYATFAELEYPKVLSDVHGEMPRCDDRFATRKHRHVYGSRVSSTGFNGVMHVDTFTGITQVWEAGNGVLVGETCFVPRSPNAAEGDGYLLVCTRDPNLRQAHLTILDASNVVAGPVAVIDLPFQLQEGVHGNWVNASDMPVRKPIVDYSGVTKEIQAKFGTGRPHPYEEFTGKPVALTWDDAITHPYLKS
ncbi:carotenoid oxygenase [Corynespora cassiicola Philippines]|uniref:Carotenoid oxygenase n=1 Tax=Corynespora cassiicola Philippines TaxID=1448308 RepID=A0A2T2N4T8_CORCC|nr:carotenoid oxygenase [Corynespora cassiicola Philippines]